MSTKTMKVDYLARVEGEASLNIRMKDGTVKDVQFAVFEPPRFFEAFLKGRRAAEAPDITARICGICPVAYQMSSCHAIEQAYGVTVDGTLRDLRRLLYCGEWIESHALHVHLLHAPDFLGYQDGIQMAADHPMEVKRGLRIKKIGNDIVNIVGGREIHPINVRLGGFYKAPARQRLTAMLDDLKWAYDASVETIRWTASLPIPEFERDYEYVALRHPREYPMNEGRVVSNKGLDIPNTEFEQHFVEEHAPYSNALQCALDGRPYHVGPLARYNVNFDLLPKELRRVAESVGMKPPVLNPFKSIVARAVETAYACGEAIRLIEGYQTPEKSSVTVEPRASTGCGCTEAPRGILYHRYKLDDLGVILDAKIVPPTAQNQKTMEDDLRQLVPENIGLPEADLLWRCEQSVRNYDPCISCATHFLKLNRVEE